MFKEAIVLSVVCMIVLVSCHATPNAPILLPPTATPVVEISPTPSDSMPVIVEYPQPDLTITGFEVFEEPGCVADEHGFRRCNEDSA